jgi:hypothetical protein
VSEIIAAALFTLIQIPLAFVFTAVLVFLSLPVDACAGRTCNLEAGEIAVLMPLIVGAIVLLLSIVLVIAWARRGRTLWPVPAAGLALIVIDFVVALIVNNLSLTPSG